MNFHQQTIKELFAPDPKTLIQQNHEQVKQIIGQHELAEHTAQLLWNLELFTYKTKLGEIFVGFGDSAHIHDHDRWLMYRNSETSEWLFNGFEGCLNKLESQEPLSISIPNEQDLIINPTNQLIETVASLWKTVSYVRSQRPELKRIGAEYIILTQRLSSTKKIHLKTLKALQKEYISPKDLHDLACHRESFINHHEKFTGVPTAFIMAMFDVDTSLGF
jgi:hypothetical protein